MFFYGKYLDKLKEEKFKDKKSISIAFDMLEVVIDVLLILCIFYIFFDIRLVPSGSMEPNVIPKDHVFFQKPSAYLDNIHRGDVVLFDATNIAPETEQSYNIGFINKLLNKTEVDYLKRVIALEGDKVKIENGVVYINGKEYKYDFDINEDNTYSTSSEVTVPKGYVFTMGDNRPNSYDGRYWGKYDENIRENKVDGFKCVGDLTFVSKDKVKSKAVFVFNVSKLKIKSI